MCGIAGIVNFNGAALSESRLTPMLAAMKHRGPDDEGVFVDANVGLAFVRLSILDLSKQGHQPMHSKDGRYVIAFNGEIYNYIELREELMKEGIGFSSNSDTEVLLQAYIKWGEDCQHKLNGMWAFVIYDKETKQLFFSRDRFGIKPFYYIKNETFFAFASEIPVLLNLLSAKPSANKKAIFDYLVYNRTDQTEDTFFSEIKKLQHGYQIQIAEKNFKVSKWYDLTTEVQKNSGFTSAEEYKQLLISSVNLCLRSDVPVGVCLSGGLDSSAITSIISKELKVPEIHTFSAVYDKGQRGNESAFIDEYRGDLKNMFFTSPNATTLLQDLDKLVATHPEPIPSTSPYAQFKVMELAQKHVKVTLDGQGADEQLAGYHEFFGYYYKELFKNFRIVRLFTEVFEYLKVHKSTYGLVTFFYFLLPKNLKTRIRLKKNGYLQPEFLKHGYSNDVISGKLYGSPNLKQALINHFEFKLEHLLKWEDCNSMHFSIEARVPFLDHRLVEKTIASENSWKIRKGITKYILREAMKGVLPEKIRMRMDKIGFETPQDEWFRQNQWQEFVNGILNSSSFRSRGIIDPEVAIKQFEKHQRGEANISKEIWKWVHLELWFRKYIDA